MSDNKSMIGEIVADSVGRLVFVRVDAGDSQRTVLVIASGAQEACDYVAALCRDVIRENGGKVGAGLSGFSAEVRDGELSVSREKK